MLNVDPRVGPEVENMRIICQVCGVEGYLQHITENYYRVRHYVKLDSKSKKPIFNRKWIM
jgi:hypothetical protein